MAQMNRNVNLEEIDSDALFGIEALKNQTLVQKIVFFGCVLLGVLLIVLYSLARTAGESDRTMEQIREQSLLGREESSGGNS